jgi:hypothetical protein
MSIEIAQNIVYAYELSKYDFIFLNCFYEDCMHEYFGNCFA